MKVPEPPKAKANVIVSTDIGKQTIPAAPAGAVIGSRNGGAKLTSLGKVSRYGTGDKAFAAPDGQQLYAFSVAGSSGQDGSADLSGKLAVSIDSGPGTPLPSATAKYFVLAAPTTAKTVELVLVDAGVTQTLSLLDGAPGPGNIVVATRKHTDVTLSATSSTQLVVKKGSQSGSTTADHHAAGRVAASCLLGRQAPRPTLGAGQRVPVPRHELRGLLRRRLVRVGAGVSDHHPDRRPADRSEEPLDPSEPTVRRLRGAGRFHLRC